eukprot:403365726
MGINNSTTNLHFKINKIPRIAEDNNFSMIVQQIQPDTWNNIPVCLVKGFRTIIEQLNLFNKKFKDMHTYHNQKHLKNEWSVKNLETMMYQKDDVLKQQIEQNYRKVFDQVGKNNLDNEIQVDRVKQTFDQLKTFVYKSRDNIDTQIEQITRVELQIERLNTQLHDIRRENDKMIQNGLDKFAQKSVELDRHLMVPGIIGPGEFFENIRGFLSYIYTYQTKSINELESKINMSIQQSKLQAIDETQDKLLRIKGDVFNHLDKALKQLSNESQDIISKTDQQELLIEKQSNLIRDLQDKMKVIELVNSQVNQPNSNQGSNKQESITQETLTKIYEDLRKQRTDIDLMIGEMKTQQIKQQNQMKADIYESIRSLQQKFEDLQPQSSQSRSQLNSRGKALKDFNQSEEGVFNELQKKTIKQIVNEILGQDVQLNNFTSQSKNLTHQRMKTDIGLSGKHQSLNGERTTRNRDNQKMDDITPKNSLLSPQAKYIQRNPNVRHANQKAYLDAFEQYKESSIIQTQKPEKQNIKLSLNMNYTKKSKSREKDSISSLCDQNDVEKDISPRQNNQTIDSHKDSKQVNDLSLTINQNEKPNLSTIRQHISRSVNRKNDLKYLDIDPRNIPKLNPIIGTSNLQQKGVTPKTLTMFNLSQEIYKMRNQKRENLNTSITSRNHQQIGGAIYNMTNTSNGQRVHKRAIGNSTLIPLAVKFQEI